MARHGGLVKATVSVTPGENLAIFVGGEGEKSGAAGGRGGFNGGGASGVAVEVAPRAATAVAGHRTYVKTEAVWQIESSLPVAAAERAHFPHLTPQAKAEPAVV